MRPRSLTAILLLLLSLSSGALACDLSTLGIAQATKPKVTLQSPAPGAQFHEGEDVTIQSTSTDPGGIVRVELAVDGVTVRTDVPPIPQGQTSFTLIQRWKAVAGTHTLGVRAYNAAGAASDPVLVSVTVAPGAAPSPIQPTQPTAPTVIGTQPTLPPVLPTVPLAPTATRSPTRPPASPTIAAPPGVWAVSIRLDPKEPKRGQGVTFLVTFLNTTGNPQGYRWRIRIYRPDNMKHSFGDTAPINSTIPVGKAEIASDPGWAVRGPGPCEDFLARVFWIDPDSKAETEFLKPDQSGGPAVSFQVCP